MALNAIICVDDERSILDSLKKELEEGLGREYLIEVAENGNDAIELYDELTGIGYRILVFIADYIMPGMKGDELLKIIHKKNNRSYKIMLTGQAETKGITNAVNTANLYRMLTKPWNYDDLIFTIREACNNYLKNELIEKQYNELLKNKELFESFQASKFVDEEIKKDKLLVHDDKNEIFNYVLPSIIDLTTVFERGFYLSPVKHIIRLATHIADKLQLNYEKRASLVITALLYHKVMQNLPENFVGIDPNTLEEKEAKLYFNKYNEVLDKLSKDIYLNKYILILSEIWEHYNGTGLPHKLNHQKLTLISQILNLAIIYHSGVYKFTDEDIKNLNSNFEVVLRPEITALRHSETMKYLIKNSSWFDGEIIEIMKDMMNSNAKRDIFVERDLIKIYIRGDDIKTAKFKVGEYKIENDLIIIPYEKIIQELKLKEEAQSKANQKKSLETLVELKDLHPGMITGTDIFTKFGRLIITQDTLLTKDDIDEIKKVQRQGVLKENMEFRVFVPREV
ncbi:MAG: histidine kinase [Ignavibacteria bacterium]|nr:histidine kinase [Ignavibacteria bacterium]